jgi:RNA polymerase sigma-70 factor (ECF subfamily)
MAATSGLAIQHHRRKWFRLSFFGGTAHVEANIPHMPPVAGHLTDEDILAALERLPGDYRAAVLLVDVEEFSCREAAGILSVPIGTVMSRLSRGRRMLREQLAGVAAAHGFGKPGQKREEP